MIMLHMCFVKSGLIGIREVSENTVVCFQCSGIGTGFYNCDI